MKKMLVLMIVLLMCSTIVSAGLFDRITGNAVEDGYCKDSDGYDIYVQGHAGDYSSSGLIKEYKDRCADDLHVLEYYCLESGGTSVVDDNAEYCDFGCKEGACLREPLNSCTDSDGYDIHTKGEITVVYDGYEDTEEDYCLDQVTLNEFSCEGTEFVEDEVECDYACAAGVCIREPMETCKDSDGINKHEQGEYYAVSGIYVEEGVETCYSETLLDEAYCDDGVLMFTEIECVCEEGRCIAEIEECKDTCPSEGKEQCNGDAIEVCYDTDGDGCVEWEIFEKCSSGCQDGACVKKALQFDGDLSDYPDPFIMGDVFDGLIVVGDKAPSEDVLAAIDIAQGLQKVTTEMGHTLEVKGAVLASEVDDPKKHNIISVGTPCNNPVSDELMGHPGYCNKGMIKGKGKIQAYGYNGYMQVVVAGYTSEDTRIAAKYLAQMPNMNGDMICVGGTLEKQYESACVQETVEEPVVPEATEEKVCKDSDHGKNYYEQGYVKATGDDLIYKDKCAYGQEGNPDTMHDKNLLFEAYCFTEEFGYGYDQYYCPNGCKAGKCLPFIEQAVEEVITEEEVIESSVNCEKKVCTEISKQCSGTDKVTLYECVAYIEINGACEKVVATHSEVTEDSCTDVVAECQGCELNKGTCVPFGTRVAKEEVGYYCSIEKKMTEQKHTSESCQNSYECETNNCKEGACTPVCSGCMTEEHVCVPIGTRTEELYCHTDYDWKNQRTEEVACNNNYECSTNFCIDSQCVSPGLIRKMMEWFKNIF